MVNWSSLHSRARDLEFDSCSLSISTAYVQLNLVILVLKIKYSFYLLFEDNKKKMNELFIDIFFFSQN